MHQVAPFKSFLAGRGGGGGGGEVGMPSNYANLPDLEKIAPPLAYPAYAPMLCPDNDPLGSLLFV